MKGKWLGGVLTVGFVGAALCAAVAAAGDNGSKDERVLTKVTFVHYKKGHGKPANPGKGGGKNPDGGYYAYISKGAKWRTTEAFRLNLACDENTGGSLDGVIGNAVAAGMEAWETAGGAGLSIFGGIALDRTATYQNGDYRGSNTISFGLYGDPNVIGITTVWGYFSGPVSQREIIEAHILLNDEFQWGDASADSNGDGSPDSFLMDVQDIATHELGHVAGMGDLYETGASEETMYGYSTEGELKKRDLYKGDIAGVTGLYK